MSVPDYPEGPRKVEIRCNGNFNSRREQLWESLMVRLQSSLVDRAVWRWPLRSCFVEEGAYVFITGRRQEALDEAVKLIGRNVTGVRGDAANLGDLDRLFETVKRES
jgi:hypothetical protein